MVSRRSRFIGLGSEDLSGVDGFEKSSTSKLSGGKELGNLKQITQSNENYEFDLLVKILKIFEKDEYNLELRIKDVSNEMWFIVIPKLKFGPLKEGEIIRIRSVTVNITSKRNVIQCKPSTWPAEVTTHWPGRPGKKRFSFVEAMQNGTTN